MRSFSLALLTSVFSTQLLATPVAAPVRAEIDALLSTLQSSGCQFNRNDAWYDAAQAKSHLMDKLAYLEGKDAVQTTEHFIDRAASGSSMSGKPYLVKCDGSSAVESRHWLSTQLKRVRSLQHPAAAGPR